MSTPHRGRWAVAAALPLALTLAGVLAAGLVDPDHPAPRPVAEVPGLARVTCPVLGAPGTLVATGRDLAVTAFDGDAVASPFAAGAVTEPVVVTQRGGEVLAAGALSRIGGRTSWTECGAPTATGAVVAAEPEASELVLANADHEDAVVDVMLTGPDGTIASPGLRGITVPARTTTRVPLSVHVRGTAPVTASFVASQGRVLAAVRGTGNDPRQVAATQPERVAVVGQVPAGASAVRVVLTNPDDERASVTVDVLGARGRFTPANGTITLEPHTTLALDLTRPLARAAAGVVVTADVPVLSLVEARVGDNTAWLAATVPAAHLDDVVPEGSLQVVNPSTEQSQVTLVVDDGTSTFEIPAGGSRTLTVKAGHVRLDATQPVAGAVRVAGPGASTARVRAGQAPVRPSPGVLDPALGQR